MANFQALERDCCRFSSSRAWRLRAKSLRPARNGSTRSNTTATACRPGSTGATSVCLTRKKLDWTERFRSIADALKALGLGSALIDGEIVVEDASGISSFNNLQADLKAGRLDRFRYFVFDILYCEGFDLTKAVLKDRKELLQQLLAGLPAGSPIRFSEHLDVDGPTMLEHSCRLGLEGIISKRSDLPYRSGRGDHWLKSKCVERQEFVILGYVPSTVGSRSVGSLALGYHDRRKTYLRRPGRDRVVQ